jgi:hypothetical protein
MNSSLAWLPPLVPLDAYGGDWDTYVKVLHSWFRRDFVDSKPNWPGKPVRLKRMPMEKGKEATFWHFISEGESEADRTPDLRRCERIRWPRPTMEEYTGRCPTLGDRTVWWQAERRGEARVHLALPDFSYVVVVVDRGEYVLPWTAFCVEYEHQREKKRREYEEYWRTRKS